MAEEEGQDRTGEERRDCGAEAARLRLFVCLVGVCDD